MTLLIDTILVAQGAEYQTVCRGVGRLPGLTVLPMPVGPVPLRRYLNGLQQSGQFVAGQRVVVMGLCGGLMPQAAIADVVLYKECLNLETAAVLPCDTAFTQHLHTKVTDAALVQAATSDRLIWSAQEKHQLAQRYGAAVVDMEGFTALDVLHKAGVTIAMLRVVSDNAQHDLPNLTPAISADGALQPLPLAWGMIKQPIAATRLISGSLRGLKRLQAVTQRLCHGL